MGADVSDDLRVGDKIKDNDPRMGERVLIVVSVPTGLPGDNDKVIVVRRSSTRRLSISRERIFTDGKPRRYGFNKVSA